MKATIPSKRSSTKVAISCKTCGKEFLAWPSEIKRGRVRCSRSCSSLVQRNCHRCGKPILIKPFVANRQEVSFCCRACYSQWRGVDNRIKSICPSCHKPFHPRPNRFRKGNDKFCSKACFAKSLERPIEERFWEKVNKNGTIPKHRPELGPCWIWIGSKNREGYGGIGVGTRTERTHRVAWMIQNGEIPVGKEICHSCDNPSCVRGSHLFSGTHQENMSDCANKGRKKHGENHPKAKLTEEVVRFIRSCSDLNQTQLSAMFHVTKTTIQNVVHMVTWKHVV